MKIVGDKMTAAQLKEKVLIKAVRGAHVLGTLEAVVSGECDSYYHIHDNEQIPANVGVLIKIR